MYPASLEQFESFIACAWGDVLFIEIYDGDKLIAVSVTDQLGTEEQLPLGVPFIVFMIQIIA